MSTLIHKAHCVVDSVHLTEEPEILRTTFSRNGYGKWDIDLAFRKYEKQAPLIITNTVDGVIRAVTIVPFCSTVTNHLTRLHQRRKIK